MNLVAAGMGVSILPEIYAKTGIPGVVFKRLDTEDAASRLLLAYRSNDNSPLLKRFVDMSGSSMHRS